MTDVSKAQARAGGPGNADLSLWEAAYRSFETPQEEIRKFVRRLVQLGARDWPRDARIVELFCGHGNGLHALSQLGFTRLEGLDLSLALVAEYAGPAGRCVADCRSLPLASRSRDIVVINGGLHHLAKLPEDLEQTLAEAHRVLRQRGKLALVEPWLTPFLTVVHQVCNLASARRLSRKINALATMIDLEQPVYGAWLARPREILSLIDRFFEPERCWAAWGKLLFVGTARPRPG